MFDVLTQGFKDATLRLKGQTRLTEENISSALDAVRRSLLDADVDFKVVNNFLAKVRKEALDSVVATKAGQMKANAGDHFIKLCHDNILQLLGNDSKVALIENTKGPTVVLLVGLQGSGKTTHAAKLAKLMKEQHNKRPLLVAADVYRPAAREQLKVLGERIDVPVFTLDDNNAVEIARRGLEHARAEWLDFVIIDTAGRLAIDESLMQELENIQGTIKPQNILLVIDSMIGQDAVRTASVFDTRLGLSGVILTKLDGDTRGGAALSIKNVTGKNILFVGTGEGLDKLEEFRPEGMASRILGMGDIVGLMDDFRKVVDEDQAMSSAQRLMEGHFNFNDFLDMMSTIQRMGPLKDVVAKTPLAGHLSEADYSKLDDRETIRMSAIVKSMTKSERENPDLLSMKSSGARNRIARIARGSGRQEKDVKDIIEKFMQMRQMVQMFSGGMGGGLLSKIPGMGSISKMANMAKMMRGMGGANPLAGMMGGMDPFGGMMGGAGGGASLSTKELADLNREKKRRKEEKRLKQKKKK